MRASFYRFIQRRIVLVAASFALGSGFPSVLWAQGVIENPQNAAPVSGINVVSGWHCSGRVITISFDGGPQFVTGSGTIRTDTIPVCGDDNNGFSFLWNWNKLNAGQHTVRAFADGVQFAQATFSVITTGEEFLRGLSGLAIAPQFPATGLDTILAWQESLQNFVIVGGQPHVPSGGGGQKCTEHTIAEVDDEFIELEDGSVWEVNFADQFKTVLWFFPHRVLLCDLNTDIGDQRTMINLTTSGTNIIRVTEL